MFQQILSLVLLAQSNNQECLPQYPKSLSGIIVCIQATSPDLDCKDIGFPILVVEVEGHDSDPHKLDRDGDGIGCENYRTSEKQ